MNLEALKGTFKRAQVWIKKNPKKAAIAGVVLAILIYFAIKQGSNSDGESLAGGEATSDSSGLDSFGAGLATGGGGESSSSLGGGSGGIGSGESAPALSGGFTGSDFVSAGGYEDSSFGLSESFLPEFPASGFVNSSPAFPASSSSILSGSKSSANTLASKPAPVASTPAIKAAESLVKKTVPVIASSKSANTIASKPAPVIATKTDAERAGLSKYFTGTAGGKIYSFGAFVGNAPVIRTTVSNKTTASKVAATSSKNKNIR